MSSLRTTNPLALRLLFQEDLYLVDDLVQQVHIDNQATELPKPEQDYIFHYLGENNRYFLILVNHPAFEIIDPKELEALLNILQAKKLELRDVAILNVSKFPGVTFKALKKYFAANKLVLFGVDPNALRLTGISANRITVIEDVKVLASFSFAEMLADTNKKRLFWNEMKQL